MMLAEANIEQQEWAEAMRLISHVRGAAQLCREGVAPTSQLSASWHTTAAIKCSLGMGRHEEAQQLIASLLTEHSCPAAAACEVLALYTAHCLQHPASFGQLCEVAVAALRAHPQAQLPMAFLSQMLGTGDVGSPAQDELILRFLGDEQVQELVMQVSGQPAGVAAAAADVGLLPWTAVRADAQGMRLCSRACPAPATGS